MEWRACLAFIPYERLGAPRRLEFLYQITWQKKSEGAYVVNWSPVTLQVLDRERQYQ